MRSLRGLIITKNSLYGKRFILSDSLSETIFTISKWDSETCLVSWGNESVGYSNENCISFINDGVWILIE
jgi:hypothetical protein